MSGAFACADALAALGAWVGFCGFCAFGVTGAIASVSMASVAALPGRMRCGGRSAPAAFSALAAGLPSERPFFVGVSSVMTRWFLLAGWQFRPSSAGWCEALRCVFDSDRFDSNRSGPFSLRRARVNPCIRRGRNGAPLKPCAAGSGLAARRRRDSNRKPPHPGSLKRFPAGRGAAACRSKTIFCARTGKNGRKKAEKEPSHAKIRSRGSGHVKKRLLNKMRKDLRPAEPERYRAGPTQIGPSPKPLARDSRRTRLRIFSCCFSTFVRLLFDFCGRALLRRSARLRCGTLLARLIHPLLFPKRRVLLGLSRLHAASRDAAWLCLVPGGFKSLPSKGTLSKTLASFLFSPLGQALRISAARFSF